MKQLLQAGVIVLLLLTISGVLLTPDPSDDPAGVMVRLEKRHLLVISLLVAQAVFLPALAVTRSIVFSRAQILPTTAKLDLICARLC
jgi:hypothetical protein